MPVAAAQVLVAILGLYALIGVAFAAWFAASAVDRFDEAARGSGIAFRALIFPGSIALWPVVLAAWARRRREAGHA